MTANEARSKYFASGNEAQFKDDAADAEMSYCEIDAAIDYYNDRITSEQYQNACGYNDVSYSNPAQPTVTANSGGGKTSGGGGVFGSDGFTIDDIGTMISQGISILDQLNKYDIIKGEEVVTPSDEEEGDDPPTKEGGKTSGGGKRNNTEPTNWLLIGGIAAGVLVVGGIIWLIVRKKNAANA